MNCDIVIPIWNQLHYTEQCISSVFEHTHLLFSLILVDNESDVQTATYLDKVKEKNPEKVTLIRNSENLGFVKAVNQGMKNSCAPYVCLLNNDTQVTDNWLSEMLKVAESSKEIGIVNPNSNTLGCKPKIGQSLEELAQELKSFSGQYSHLAWASGFCMLIKREVIQKIGLFDQIYGMGTFEDADFSKRAQHFEYLSVCAKAAYVFHQERRSFIKFKEFNQDFQRNRKIFHTRWGKMQRILYVLTKNNAAYIEHTGQEALQLAQKGHIVWIILKGRPRQAEQIKRHSNIYVYGLPKSFFNLNSFWRILKRKKKFDKIYVDNENYGKKLNNLKLFHKAEVIYAR